MEESWRRKWKVVRKWNVIVWKGILFLSSVSWDHSTLLQTQWASVSLKSCPVWFVFVYVLTACVFITRDTVCHLRHFVFGKFACKLNCSWSEVFVNRGLTVCHSYALIPALYCKDVNFNFFFFSFFLSFFFFIYTVYIYIYIYIYIIIIFSVP